MFFFESESLPFVFSSEHPEIRIEYWIISYQLQPLRNEILTSVMIGIL